MLSIITQSFKIFLILLRYVTSRALIRLVIRQVEKIKKKTVKINKIRLGTSKTLKRVTGFQE